MMMMMMMMGLMALISDNPFVEGKNMNDDGTMYKIANSLTNQGMEYPDDMEYFDVYSKPIKTLYSQVHWTSHGGIPLPADIVERFANGKVMAITGYEVDQVRQLNDQGEEVSVPITWSYNHHYGVWMYNSEKNHLIKKEATTLELQHMSHGADHVWVVEPKEDAEDEHDNDDGIPTNQMFSEGNGGEMRKSYHGYPKGYAQLIKSPDTFTTTPMQIDCWNRDTMSNGTFVPDPSNPNLLPNSFRPIDPTVAGYNPLLECPCTDRLRKEWSMTYKVDSEDNNGNGCEGPIENATECFEAVPQIIPAIHVRTHIVTPSESNDDDLPAGCSASLGKDGNLDVAWKQMNQHRHNSKEEREGDDLFEVSEERTTSSTDDKKIVGVGMGVFNMTVVVPTITTGTEQYQEDVVEITMTGPADKWYGAGFGTDSMCIHMEADECPSGGPYAIVVVGDQIQERKLGFHGKGTVFHNQNLVK